MLYRQHEPISTQLWIALNHRQRLIVGITDFATYYPDLLYRLLSIQTNRPDDLLIHGLDQPINTSLYRVVNELRRCRQNDNR